MNSVILIGNLCTDPTARTTSGGKSQSSFRLAVQRQYKNSHGVREADFFNVVCFGVTADFVYSYMTKGRKIAVEGSIQNRSYDTQDGTKKWMTEIVAQHVEPLGGRENAQADSAPAQDAPPARNEQQYMQYGSDFAEVDDPDLPDYF